MTPGVLLAGFRRQVRLARRTPECSTSPNASDWSIAPIPRIPSGTLRAEQERDPALLRPVLAEEIGGLQRVISYAAVRLTPGVDFAGLWGGTTHAEWRGRGLYRALTAYRARLALDAGHPYVRVDTSPDSRPILTRLGLHQVTTTTPCVLDPRGSSRSG